MIVQTVNQSKSYCSYYQFCSCFMHLQTNISSTPFTQMKPKSATVNIIKRITIIQFTKSVIFSFNAKNIFFSYFWNFFITAVTYNCFYFHFPILSLQTTTPIQTNPIFDRNHYNKTHLHQSLKSIQDNQEVLCHL